METIIQLDVGGQYFSLFQSELLRVEGSLFHDLVKSNWATVPKLNERYFFSRDPKLFRPIYEYLIGSKDSLYHPTLGISFFDELLFWGIFESEFHKNFVCSKIKSHYKKKEGYSSKFTKEIIEAGNKVIEKVTHMIERPDFDGKIRIPIIHKFLHQEKDVMSNAFTTFYYNQKDVSKLISHIDVSAYLNEIFEKYLIDFSITSDDPDGYLTFRNTASEIYYYIKHNIGPSIQITFETNPPRIDYLDSFASTFKNSEAIKELLGDFTYNTLAVYTISFFGF